MKYFRSLSKQIFFKAREHNNLCTEVASDLHPSSTGVFSPHNQQTRGK